MICESSVVVHGRGESDEWSVVCGRGDERSVVCGRGEGDE